MRFARSVRPSPARARPADESAWFPVPNVDALPKLDELLDPQSLAAPRSTHFDRSVRPAPVRARPMVRPSPARARPHDPTAWLPVPDVDTLPELEELLAPDQLVHSGQTQAVTVTEPLPTILHDDLRALRPASRPEPAPTRASRQKRSRTHRRRRIALMVLATAAFVTLALSVPQLLAGSPPKVTVVVDGKHVSLRTNARTVGQLLRRQHVKLGFIDRVTPSGTTQITDGLRVSVLRAFPVVVDFDGQVKPLPTTRVRPAELVSDLKLDPTKVTLIDPPTRLARGITVTIRTLKTVTIAVDGTTLPEFTSALTVAEFLEKNGVVLNPFDQVSPPVSTPLAEGLTVTVSRITGDSATFDEHLPPPTQTQEDPTLREGQQRVAQQGSPGVQRVTYQRTLRDGQEVARSPISKVPINPPTPTIIVVGTMKPNSRQGSASWYDSPFGDNSCATKTYVPMGTLLRVTNLDTGRSTTCVVSDRVEANRAVDLDDNVFARLAVRSQGTFPVQIDW